MEKNEEKIIEGLFLLVNEIKKLREEKKVKEKLVSILQTFFSYWEKEMQNEELFISNPLNNETNVIKNGKIYKLVPQKGRWKYKEINIKELDPKLLHIFVKSIFESLKRRVEDLESEINKIKKLIVFEE